jgi:hypothetical protein
MQSCETRTPIYAKERPRETEMLGNEMRELIAIVLAGR